MYGVSDRIASSFIRKRTPKLSVPSRIRSIPAASAGAVAALKSATTASQTTAELMACRASRAAMALGRHLATSVSV